jgi:hypothetical protein
MRRRGKTPKEFLPMKFLDTKYQDSKIKSAVHGLLVSNGILRERIRANLSGLTFLETDSTGRFESEGKIIKKALSTVKNEDFSKVTNAELEAIAEAALSVHTKMAIAESAANYA